jgi:hypothetical protein
VRRTSGALTEWIKGLNARAREREDRETAHIISQDLENGGGLWLDRDGQRIRLIIRPGSEVSVSAVELAVRSAKILPVNQDRDDITPQ